MNKILNRSLRTFRFKQNEHCFYLDVQSCLKIHVFMQSLRDGDDEDSAIVRVVSGKFTEFKQFVILITFALFACSLYFLLGKCQ